jgi:hypothetical protein
LGNIGFLAFGNLTHGSGITERKRRYTWGDAPPTPEHAKTFAR